MTAKVLIVNAGNRTGDKVEIDMGGGRLGEDTANMKRVTLSRGESMVLPGDIAWVTTDGAGHRPPPIYIRGYNLSDMSRDEHADEFVGEPQVVAAMHDALRDILEKARSTAATRADGMLLSHDEAAILVIHLDDYLSDRA